MTQVEFNAWIRARFNLWTKSDVDAAIKEALAQRTWVGLTDDEISALSKGHIVRSTYARAIEAKLKERNT